MRIYLTGAGGFVGRHLTSHLRDAGDDVIAPGIPGTPFVDVTDAAALSASLQESSPDAVVHLAAQASVPKSWEDPLSTYQANVIGTLNVLEALRATPATKLLLVGSAQQYAPVPEVEPISEDHPLVPSSPYAASKIAAEQLAMLYARSHGTAVCSTRSFNHTGPGQSPHYAVGSFASQIAAIESGTQEPKIHVGDLSPRRDLLDVRDVVIAYRSLLDKGLPGEAYNVCSGEALSIGEILEIMLKSAGLLGEVQVIEEKGGRKNDPSVIVGDPSKLKSATGWQPRIPLEKSLIETIDWYREALTQETT